MSESTKELTDNDRAATFIGWEPDRYDYIHYFWRDKDGMRSPDMTYPSNYMKALDKLVAKYGAIQVTLTHNGVGIATPGFAHQVIKNRWPEALAALYDAERPS